MEPKTLLVLGLSLNAGGEALFLRGFCGTLEYVLVCQKLKRSILVHWCSATSDMYLTMHFTASVLFRNNDHRLL